ncbi:response regulator [Marivirga sp. S37H4]|uniref:Response regulator n=1 Tax=Marivirga aurantiaca TaxID=2802615 RepID=A0A935C8Y1_9BACT|nr:response regulator [Marivirga aurantiaca]MBK6265750.1 response regulator [Marivirga aurantiaca]
MKTIQILLVEDNEGDAFLAKEAMEDSKIPNVLYVVENGQEALDFVFQRSLFENSPVPDLILLDINLPIKSGHEVLKEVKTSSTKNHIPVIILTTSSAQRDIDLAYQYHANCYITKPVNAEEFIMAVNKIEQFWNNIGTLPPK